MAYILEATEDFVYSVPGVVARTISKGDEVVFLDKDGEEIDLLDDGKIVNISEHAQFVLQGVTTLVDDD